MSRRPAVRPEVTNGSVFLVTVAFALVGACPKAGHAQGRASPAIAERVARVPQRTIPNLFGHPIAEALAALRAMGISVVQRDSTSDAVTKDHIVAQAPRAGTVVVANMVETLFVASSPHPYRPPSVVAVHPIPSGRVPPPPSREPVLAGAEPPARAPIAATGPQRGRPAGTAETGERTPVREAAREPRASEPERRVPSEGAIHPGGSEVAAPVDAAEGAWLATPLGQAMMEAKDSLIPVFKTTEITITVAQGSIPAIAQQGAIRTETTPGDSRIRISRKVSVMLIANGCHVDSLSSSEQLVMPGVTTQWRFRVTPQLHGDLPIVARINDIYQTNGPAYAVHVTDLTLRVTSRPVVELLHVINEHQAQLLPLFGGGGAGALLIGWLLGRSKRRGTSPTTTEP